MTNIVTLGYGLAYTHHAIGMAARVCDAISHGGNGKAVHLLLETAAQETKLGTFIDPTPYYAGAGLCQVDKGTFDWLRDLYANNAVAKRLKEYFGITLGKVQYVELEHSPLLSFIFCRLRYCAVPAPIPDTLEGRAAYWKKWYNSTAGKGTPEEYIASAKLAQPLIEKYEEDRDGSDYID